MSATERLGESVRVRLSTSDKAELDQAAADEERSAGAIARRAIRTELARLRRLREGRR